MDWISRGPTWVQVNGHAMFTSVLGNSHKVHLAQDECKKGGMAKVLPSGTNGRPTPSLRRQA